jgi:Glycosyl hydrolases family 6
MAAPHAQTSGHLRRSRFADHPEWVIISAMGLADVRRRLGMGTLALLVLLALALHSAARSAASVSTGNPLVGHQVYADCDGSHESTSRYYKAWYWVRKLGNTRQGRLVRRIAQVPGVKWFTTVAPSRHSPYRMGRLAERFFAQVDDPNYGGPTCDTHLARGHRDAYVGSYPIVALRFMQHYRCGGYDGQGKWNRVHHGYYKGWINTFIRNMERTYVADPGHRYKYWNSRVYPYGHFRTYHRQAAVILEPDALGLMGKISHCLTRRAKRSELSLLRYAAKRLGSLPNITTYLDAGASDWLKPREAVSLLRKAGVKYVRGFAVNSTHFESTRHELAFGNKIARRLHKFYVINTAENAHGSLPRRRWTHGFRSKFCNPRNAGLGRPPTAHTGSRWADAYLWISRPGISSNGKAGKVECGVGPNKNVFWLPKALWEAQQASPLARRRGSATL